MAKSIVLYGVFLGALFGLCNYFGGVGVGSYQHSAVSYRPSTMRYLSSAMRNQLPCVILSGVGYKVLGISYEQSAFSYRLSDSRQEDLVRAKIQQIYSAEIGVREATGKNDGKRVEEYLAVTQLGKGYAWCASFVSWVFAEAGFPQPRSPWSPSLFPKNRIIWEYQPPNPSRLKPDPPATADVFGIYFTNLKRIAHVGFVDEWGDKYVITVEGNTNEAGSNEGDGVYKKRRLISSIYQVADWVQGQERGMR